MIGQPMSVAEAARRLERYAAMHARVRRDILTYRLDVSRTRRDVAWQRAHVVRWLETLHRLERLISETRPHAGDFACCALGECADVQRVTS